jgi:hypothetical protein
MERGCFFDENFWKKFLEKKLTNGIIGSFLALYSGTGGRRVTYRHKQGGVSINITT